MRAICVDDERLQLNELLRQCEGLDTIDEALGFTNPAEVLKWAEKNTVQLAILDIDMPGMNGIELAIKLKEAQPDMRVIFLTGYTEYAAEVFAKHIEASGYILKPVSTAKLAQEVEYALHGRQDPIKGRVYARTFGEFDLLVDGRTVSFPRAKSKELLAYLIDRQGGSVSRKTIYAALWEDGGAYDRSKQKYLDVIIHSLKDTLEKYSVVEILEMKRGMLRVIPEKLDCDMYRLMAGDAQAVNSYRGEYMSAYSWAAMTEAYMDYRRHGKNL